MPVGKRLHSFELIWTYWNRYAMMVMVMMIIKGSPRAHLDVVGMLRFMFLTYTNRACPPLFILIFCLFLSLWPFPLYFTPWILSTTLHFLTLFFRSYFCLVGPFNYISLMKVSFSPNIILCGWLGLKHQLTTIEGVSEIQIYHYYHRNSWKHSPPSLSLSSLSLSLSHAHAHTHTHTHTRTRTREHVKV